MLNCCQVLADGLAVKPQRRKGSHFTLPNSTVSSEDPVHYRHFAVDVSNDIIYMCDMNPYRPLDRSACWVSKDQGALWIREFQYSYTESDSPSCSEQPKYIRNIIGYSPKSGRMYFQVSSGLIGV